VFGIARALLRAWRRKSHRTLRITIKDEKDSVAITLDGRVAGPWVEELNRVWADTAPRIASKKLSLDLRNVTFADAGGELVLKEIYAQTGAELVTSTPWTQYLAEAIKGNNK
jgi:hypothetical protein